MEAVIMGALTLCALQDLKKKEITYRCLVCLAAVVGLSLIVQKRTDWLDMGLGAGVGILLLILGKLTGQIGAADGILLLLTGLFLGWRKNLALFFMALLLTAVVAIFLLVFMKKSRKYEVPFAPFLCIAFAIIQWG